MSVEVTRDEFEARVGTVEREVEGEKMVTRYVLEQSRRNGDDLAIVRSRLERLESKFDNLEHLFDGLGRKVDALDGKVDGLHGNVVALRGDVQGLSGSLREAIRDAMQKALDEHERTHGS